MDMLLSILESGWQVAVEAAPYVLAGLFVAGVLKAALGDKRLPVWLRGEGPGPVLKAAVAGVPLPLCSCSVLPVAMELRRKGASKGATASFLVSTPQTGIDSILLTAGMIGWPFAIVRIVAAFVSGTAAGMTQTLFPTKGETEPAPTATVGGGCCGGRKAAEEPPPPAKSCCSSPEKQDVAATGFSRFLAGQKYAAANLFESLGKYYLLGILATGVVMAFLPPDFVEQWFGGGILGMLAITAAGMAVYLCASGATPLAAALLAKGMSPGTGLVMLMAGPATSIASLLAVRSMLGTRGLGLYLAAIVTATVGMGLLIDLAIPAAWLASQAAAELGHEHYGPVRQVLGGAFLLWCVVVSVRQPISKAIRRDSPADSQQAGSAHVH